MKIIWLAIILSAPALADFVYMKEDSNGKSIQLATQDQTITLNEANNGNWALYPDLTPDAQEIIYSEGPGAQDLHLTYFQRASGIRQRFHLKDKGMVLHPKFTKNGKYIFYSAPGKNGKNTIYFFDRAQEVARQGKHLTDFNLDKALALDENEESYFPRPSSDGSFVVYQRNSNGKREIILFDRIEKTKTVLAEGMSPALSFDERLIAFTAKSSKGDYNIYVIDRISKTTIQVTRDPKDEMAPTFMPDNKIAFASNRNGDFELFRLSDRKWRLMVSSKGVDYYSPQFSGELEIKQSEKASFIGNPRSSFGTVSHQGKIYMAGGHQGAEHTYPPESFTDYLHVYDLATNTWKELAPRSVKAHGYQIAASGNYLYAFGGFAYSAEHKPKWKSLSNIDRYDIKNNKWETIGSLLEPRSSNVAVTIDEKVYLVGGWNSTPKFDNDADGKFHHTIEIFDLKSEKISLASFEIPRPVRRALTGVELNGEIVLIGGLGEGASHFELLSKVTAINPQSGQSRELTSLPFATFAPAAEIIGNEIFVFGGMFKTAPMNYEYVSHIYGMDMDKKSWRHTGRFLKETKGFSQVFKLNDSTLGILGGHRYFEGQDSPVRTFETFMK